MPNGRIELLKAHRASQERYIYFLLAAAGAAIAFAVSQTQTATISLTKLPLALAVAAWALSFMFGCRHIWEVSNLTEQNYQLLRVQAGLHPDFPADPIFVATIERGIEDQATRSGRFSRWQFNFLIAGAAFYIVWHIVEMYARTVTQ
jgi:hypothetical protein